jgi:hypothetical protein
MKKTAKTAINPDNQWKKSIENLALKRPKRYNQNTTYRLHKD